MPHTWGRGQREFISVSRLQAPAGSNIFLRVSIEGADAYIKWIVKSINCYHRGMPRAWGRGAGKYILVSRLHAPARRSHNFLRVIGGAGIKQGAQTGELLLPRGAACVW